MHRNAGVFGKIRRRGKERIDLYLYLLHSLFKPYKHLRRSGLLIPPNTPLCRGTLPCLTGFDCPIKTMMMMVMMTFVMMCDDVVGTQIVAKKMKTGYCECET
jgi:hypothetical protein